jgi:N-acetylglucosamine-6-phosphate deacetylase
MLGGRAVLPGGISGPVEVEVAGAHISAVRPVASRRAGDLTLVPGFVDLQVNGIDDVDVAAAEGDGWDVLDQRLAAQGVTTWLPTLVSDRLDRYPPRLARIAAAARRPGPPRPELAGVHLEGPFLGGRRGAHRADRLAAVDRAWLAGLDPIVRLVTLSPELPEALEAVTELVSRGVVVALGHTAATPDEVRAAAGAGATLVTHAFNATGPVAGRDPGPLGAALVDDRLAVSLIADRVHVDPVNLALAVRAKGPDGVVLVTDAVAWRSAWAREQGIELVDGAPRLPDGTLAGSALTMDAAVRNLTVVAGLEGAVRAAATRPARLLGLTDRGELRPGSRADVVALDRDLGVAQVWVGGVPLLR